MGPIRRPRPTPSAGQSVKIGRVAPQKKPPSLLSLNGTRVCWGFTTGEAFFRKSFLNVEMSLDRQSHGHLTTAAAADHRVSTQGSAGTQNLSYPTDAKLDKAALWPLLCDGGSNRLFHLLRPCVKAKPKKRERTVAQRYVERRWLAPPPKTDTGVLLLRRRRRRQARSLARHSMVRPSPGYGRKDTKPVYVRTGEYRIVFPKTRFAEKPNSISEF